MALQTCAKPLKSLLTPKRILPILTSLLVGIQGVCARAQTHEKIDAFRGSIFHYLDDPKISNNKSYQYIEDGLLIVGNGRIKSVGTYAKEKGKLTSATTVKDYSGMLLMPGMIDTHIHYPQTQVIASFGEQLLEWLDKYVFPAEKKFSDSRYAREQADLFLDELVRNGTTTALVFATVSPTSVNAFFEAAYARKMRMIAGKVLMDRNAPQYLLDTPKSGYIESLSLIRKWHGVGRLSYAITPRFAPTSSREQLLEAGRLKSQFPDVYVHTHLSENTSEIKWVKQLFPERSGYFDVYQYYGLSGARSVFAHGVHLDDQEVANIVKSQSVIAFCPTSNLFLGSGLFPYKDLRDKGVRISLGTDVGAGTSFSLLNTLNEAYKVNNLRGTPLGPIEAFYLATLGGAKALSLDNKIGNFLPGKEADFIVINPHATPLLSLRSKNTKTLAEQLFVLMMLGDDRAIKATYILGREAKAAMTQ